MKRLLIAAALSLTLAGCGTPAGTNSASNTALTVSDQVTLKSTTALSLGELAFTSAEQTATAALKGSVAGKKLSKEQAAALGKAVLAARGYRNQARAAVAVGQDASALLTNLSSSITDIYTITKQPEGG